MRVVYRHPTPDTQLLVSSFPAPSSQSQILPLYVISTGLSVRRSDAQSEGERSLRFLVSNSKFQPTFQIPGTEGQGGIWNIIDA